MKEVASIILGGGEGTRLYPLTLTRCKPAMNFGGKYRLIDIPISNSIHAHCHKIFILTQFLSSSLHHHLFQTYMQGGRESPPIEILTAEQKPTKKTWFQGTADAVRQNIDYLLESPVDYFLILSGDQLYNINFQEMFDFAKKTDVDVVVAALPVNSQDAMRMGVLKVDNKQFITDFYEKPQNQATLDKFFNPSLKDKNYLASMGIYLFKRKALVDLLAKDSNEDFGKHLIPTQVQSGSIAAYLYDGYWEDIGTIENFYQANMALTQPNAPFCLHHPIRPIFSYRYDLPPATISRTEITQTLLCEGAIIEADLLSHSILGPRTVIRRGTIVRDSYIMGNDYYEAAAYDHQRLPVVPQIGEDCIISKAIIDKNVQIGNRVQLINQENLTHFDGDNLFIRDGVIIIPRGAIIPDGVIL